MMQLTAIVIVALMASAAPLAYANPAPRITPTPQASYVAPIQQSTANGEPEWRVIPTPQASYVVPSPDPHGVFLVIPTPQARYNAVQPPPAHPTLALRVLPTPQARYVP